MSSGKQARIDTPTTDTNAVNQAGRKTAMCNRSGSQTRRSNLNAPRFCSDWTPTHRRNQMMTCLHTVLCRPSSTVWVPRWQMCRYHLGIIWPNCIWPPACDVYVGICSGGAALVASRRFPTLSLRRSVFVVGPRHKLPCLRQDGWPTTNMGKLRQSVAVTASQPR